MIANNDSNQKWQSSLSHVPPKAGLSAIQDLQHLIYLRLKSQQN